MNIPGYYYDIERRRYFKVESSKTAPTDAVWSSNNVKRRKLRDEDDAAALRHSILAKSRIRRARVLHEPLTGGFFAREYGAVQADMQAACFVEGLRNMGRIPLGRPELVVEGEQITSMYVSGHDHKTGMCTVYAERGAYLLSTYFPRDKNKRLNQRLLANYRTSGPYCHLEARMLCTSDMQYHAPSNRMLITSRGPSAGNIPSFLWSFCPLFDDADKDPLRPRWHLPSGPFTNLSRGANPRYNGSDAYCVAPAPESSSSLCLVGTSRGVVQCDLDIQFRDWLPPTVPYHNLPDLFRDVFTIDFHPSQADVVFRFGGRPGVLFTADTRVPVTEWSHIRLPSTITHLRCLDGGNQVLVAGLRSQLGVYDLRFAQSCWGVGDDSDRIDIDVGKRDGSDNHNNNRHNFQHGDFRGRQRVDWRGYWSKRTTKSGKSNFQDKTIAQPVIRFERYRNSAHIDIGFAYDAATGVVAAAHGDIPGTVALYSVRTGSQLRVLDFASEGGILKSQHPYDLERIDIPFIQSLQFQTFPGDHSPTLFVGSDRRGGITAFSFGVDDLEDEA